jgi:hypothetical protein
MAGGDTHGPTFQVQSLPRVGKRTVSLDKALRKQVYVVEKAKEEAKQRRYRADIEASRKEAIIREKSLKRRLTATSRIRLWARHCIYIRQAQFKLENRAVMRLQSYMRLRSAIKTTRQLRSAVAVLQCAVRMWLSQNEYRLRLCMLQHGKWTHAQADRIIALICGWRLRKLIKFPVLAKRRKTLSEMLKLASDLRRSTKVRTGDMELLATLRISVVPERRQFRALLFGDNYANDERMDAVYLERLCADSTSVALIGDKACNQLIRKQLQRYLRDAAYLREPMPPTYERIDQSPMEQRGSTHLGSQQSANSPNDGNPTKAIGLSMKKSMAALVSSPGSSLTASPASPVGYGQDRLAPKVARPKVRDGDHWQEMPYDAQKNEPQLRDIPLPERRYKSAYLQADIVEAQNLQPAAIRSGSFAALADRLPYVRCELRYFHSKEAGIDRIAEVPKQKQLAKKGRPPALPSLAPEWNECMIWPLKFPRDRKGMELNSMKPDILLHYWRQGDLLVQVWDHDRFNSDQFLGEFTIPLSMLSSPSKTAPELTAGSAHEPLTFSGRFDLRARTPRDRVKGELLMRLTLFPGLKTGKSTELNHCAGGENNHEKHNDNVNNRHESPQSSALGSLGSFGTSNMEPTDEQIARRKFNADRRRQRLAVLAKTLDKVSENLRRSGPKDSAVQKDSSAQAAINTERGRKSFPQALDWSAVKARTNSQWEPGEAGHDATRRRNKGPNVRETWRRVDLTSIPSRKVSYLDETASPPPRGHQSNAQGQTRRVAGADGDAYLRYKENGNKDTVWHVNKAGDRSTMPLVQLEAAIWGGGRNDADFWSKLGEMFTMDPDSRIFQLGAGGSADAQTTTGAATGAHGEDEKDHARAVAMQSAEYHNLRRQQAVLYRRNYAQPSQGNGGENARFRKPL